MQGTLAKLQLQSGTPVAYTLPVGNHRIDMNVLLGRAITLRYAGVIHCIACGRKTSKSFSQGYCFPCMRSLAQCDTCIVRPETCHHAAGTCREPAWAEAHCMQPHYVYLANSSGIKVGITRGTQVPTRWLDQGASQAVPVFKVATRHLSGLLEVILKKHVADRTDWRALLRGDAAPVDLAAKRDELHELCAGEIAAVAERFGEGAVSCLPGEPVVTFQYPVLRYPEKITSLSFDKVPEVSGVLQGMKGQYLILDTGVLNIRKHAGYAVSVEGPGVDS